MLSVRLPDEYDQALSEIAKETGRSKSYYVRMAIEEFIEDRQDYLLAVSRLEKNEPKMTIKEMEKALGIQD